MTIDTFIMIMEHLLTYYGFRIDSFGLSIGLKASKNIFWEATIVNGEVATVVRISLSEER
jgi:hypothetical protein